LISLFYCFLFL